MTYLEIEMDANNIAASKVYTKKLENLLDRIRTTHEAVRLGTPSSIIKQDGHVTDSYFLITTKRAIADAVADELASELGRWGSGSDVRVTLIKRSRRGAKSAEHHRRVLPSPESGWSRPRAAPPEPTDSREWPPRIRYLATLADRYYGAGGDDVVSIFPDENDAHTFIDALSSGEKTELQKAARKIANNSDNIYIMDWYDEDTEGKIPLPEAHALYFLALLQRLSEMGFFDGVPGLESFQFIDWDVMGG